MGSRRVRHDFSLSCIGEGNGNPLQCSCLENPRDGGAWWAAVYGVAQSRTRLKQLSSSSPLQWSPLLKSDGTENLGPLSWFAVWLIQRRWLKKKQQRKKMWRCRGLNPGPHTCKACALPLSYIPFLQILCSWNEDIENRIFSSFPKHCVRSGHSEFSPWVPLPIQIGPHPGEPTSQGRPALSGWRS